jgi:hypothetical protein
MSQPRRQRITDDKRHVVTQPLKWIHAHLLPVHRFPADVWPQHLAPLHRKPADPRQHQREHDTGQGAAQPGVRRAANPRPTGLRLRLLDTTGLHRSS